MRKLSLHTLCVLLVFTYAACFTVVDTMYLVACKTKITTSGSTHEFAKVTFEPSVLVYEKSVDYICEIIGNSYITADTDKVTKIYNVNLHDRELLARIAWCEAGIEGINGMMRVVCVVLNRIDDERFPNTIEKVLYSPGQFESVRLDKFMGKIPDEAYEAVDKVLSGDYPDNESLYFALSPLTKNGLYKFGRHYFSK